MESIPLDGKTYVKVPGYESKVRFGVMSHFAYPVDGSGEWLNICFIRFKDQNFHIIKPILIE